MSYRLHHGDYRETLALAGGQADLVLTSTPFADARTYGADVAWTDADYANLGDAVFAALRPGGTAIVNVDAPVREWRKGFGTERGFHPWRLMLDWAERAGFRVPDRLAFGRQGLPGEYRGRFRNDWEPPLWFEKPGGEAFFDKAPLSTVSAYGRRPGLSGRSRRNDGSTYVRPVSGEASETNVTRRGTLWDYGSVGSNQTGAANIEAQNHPARWPYRLAEDIIRCFCPPGGLAVDPFCGAGTSIAAAVAHGRRAIGGDLYARQEDGKLWVDVTRDVMDARMRQQPLFSSFAGASP